MSLPDLAVVDVETTGFAFKKLDRIVEIGIKRTDFEGNELATFETLVNPDRDVGPTHIHGITAEMVEKAPPFGALTDTVLELLDGTFLIAHNAPFDTNFLRAELSRAGDRIGEVPYCCTLQGARAVFPDLPSKKLERVCEFLDIDLTRAHSALSDAEATRQLLGRLRAERTGLVPRSQEPCHASRPPRSTTVETLSREEFEEARAKASSPLSGLLRRLPSVETDHEGADAYANVLEKALMDRIVTEEELERFASVAEDYGVSERVAEEIHLEYLQNLIRYALLDDTVTETEREDLVKVQRLLGLEDQDLDALIEDARSSLKATYRRDPAAVDQALRGKSVCFTGSLTARIDGETVSRKSAQRLADEGGMAVKKSVTRELDYLVASDPHTQSGKAEKARKYDIPIVAEMEFWRRLGVAVT